MRAGGQSTAPSLDANGPALDPNALWTIVHGYCVPNEQQHGDPAPCAAVDLTQGVERGYSVIKDPFGATQYLLVPTKRIMGIEDAALLAPDAVNYFAAAWNARSFVDKSVGRELPDDALSLAVNSPLARSQNQLHIHIDCIHVDVRSALARDGAKIGERWSLLDAPLRGHRFQAMRVMGTTLARHNPFKLLAKGVPGARTDMGQRTLVVASMSFAGEQAGFVILGTASIYRVVLPAARTCRIIYVRSRGEPELIEKTFGEARPISLGHCGDRVPIGSRLFADRPGVCAAVLRRQLAALVHARRAASVAAEP